MDIIIHFLSSPIIAFGDGGNNDCGQLGNGSTASTLKPIKIIDDVLQVSSGYSIAGYPQKQSSFAVKKDGSLWAWGVNDFDKFGDGKTTQHNTPIKIMDGVVQVAVGEGHILVLKTDKSVWAWGNNSNGQLGDGTNINRLFPVCVMNDVSKISVGSFCSYAIKSDKSLWGWGQNDGKLGDGTKLKRNKPIKIMDDVIQAVASINANYIVKSDNSLWGCGLNGMNQFLNNKINETSSMTFITKGIDHIAIGFYDNLWTVLKTDGTLWSLLPDNKADGDVGNTKYAMEADGIFEGISAGDDTIFAIRYDGSLWARGNNDSGQLGDGSKVSCGVLKEVISYIGLR